MGGLAVLFFIGLYFVIAFKVVGKFKASRYKWLAVALVVLIPSGDAVVGRLYLKYLCSKEGGLKVYRVAEHVEGFMSDTSWDGDYWLKNDGFKFSESRPVNGMVTRYSMQDGKLITENRVIPKSKYRLRSLHIGDTKNIYLRYQYVLDDMQSGEVLATHTEVGFNGGWAERFLAQFSDAGGGGVAWCTPVPWIGNPAVEIITHSLKH
jgi:hypothetical protein